MSRVNWFRLTPKILRHLSSSKNAYIKKNQHISGTGAFFFGHGSYGKHNRDIPVMYSVLDYTNKVASVGGRTEPYHKNSLQTLHDEVYEESAKTLSVSVKGNKLLLNKKINLTNRTIVLDTLINKTYGHIYRVFLFDMGRHYTRKNGFSRKLFDRNRRELLKNPKTPKSFLETKKVFHIPLIWLWLIGDGKTVRDVSGKLLPVRDRFRRLLKTIRDNELICPRCMLKYYR